MGDQFSRTIRSISDDYTNETWSEVTRASRVVGKGRKEKKSDDERGSGKEQRALSSDLGRPAPELWDVLLEAVAVFNKQQDVRKSPYEIKIMAQNDGIRIQLIHEDTGDLIKQTKIIPLLEITTHDLNDMINDLVGERGIVIDVTR